ncbi:hypothetical protein [Galbibacter pacificus]|uniref:Uncharacterized protein n=1 Tax=Galbibacter pacificus TaxID=2996052 RepID=A0ABT6FX04_9FLAO|nr:hypothetical protein [Galbibacter pacificus]MDG3583931.1 hypothetical protein [Galbibacter pacificus]MDG3587631.1 hypothetical protein [Galbibacter pacificus]
MKQFYLFLCLCICLFCMDAYSQTEALEQLFVEDMARKRQDPIAGLRSIYLQEVLLPIDGGMAQSFSIQPVWPFRLGENLKLITYTIISFQSISSTNSSSHVPIYPTPTQESGRAHAGGLDNILFNGFFTSIEKKGNISWGVGPAIQLPTRTEPILGSNRVSMGTSVLFNHGGDTFSDGFVIQNYWSLGGEGTNKVNSFNFQYFTYYNLAKGWFLESNATIVNNWLAESGDQLLLSLGGGAGKTFKIEESKLFIVPQPNCFITP